MSNSDTSSDKEQNKEKKPQQGIPPPVPAQTQQPQSPKTPPPVPAQTQQPQSPKTPPPPTSTRISRDPDKRNFFKMIVGVSAAFTLIPLIPGGIFLTALVGGGVEPFRQRIANTRDLKPNSAMNFIYPKTGNPNKDNDPFRQFVLLRLPEDMARKEGTEFKSFSEVCVHLWCLWRYDSEFSVLACPCHGSMYDPVTGIAICGPAASQPPPNDTLPELKLEIDNNTGEIYGVELIGDLGLGRTTDRKPAISFDCLG